MGRIALALLSLSLASIGPSEAAPADGATIFEGACAGCHAAGSPRVLSGQKLLPRTKEITGASPAEAIGLVLHGHSPPTYRRGAMMPAFAPMLSDDQIAAVLGWLRQDSGEPPWPDLTGQVAAARTRAKG